MQAAGARHHRLDPPPPEPGWGRARHHRRVEVVAHATPSLGCRGTHATTAGSSWHAAAGSAATEPRPAAAPRHEVKGEWRGRRGRQGYTGGGAEGEEGDNAGGDGTSATEEEGGCGGVAGLPVAAGSEQGEAGRRRRQRRWRGAEEGGRVSSGEMDAAPNIVVRIGPIWAGGTWAGGKWPVAKSCFAESPTNGSRWRFFFKYI
jgi:hypothetical protein